MDWVYLKKNHSVYAFNSKSYIRTSGSAGFNGVCPISGVIFFLYLLHSVFDVDVPIWSKLQSGYVPNIQELFHILDNHLKMNQVDNLKFASP